MPEAPKVVIINDARGGGVIAGAGGQFPIVFLGEAADGPSLNADGALIRINGSADVQKWLGPPSFGNYWHDVLQAFLDMAGVPCLFGRVTGAGGAKAQVDLDDFAATPAPTARFRWRGPSSLPSLPGSQYKIRVSRGRRSTSDAGAGRVDTKLELLSPTGEVLASLDEVEMDPQSPRYAPVAWNALGAQCEMLDLSPSDPYENTDEPAVGTFSFAAGADPAAVTAAERQAAAAALDGAQAAHFALVGVVAWGATELNALLGYAEANLWQVIVHLAEGATPTTAAALEAALTTNRDRVALHRGWGKWFRNPAKSIPGIAQVMAGAVIAARSGGGLLVNATGANLAEDRWVDFEPVSRGDREGFAAARTNPLYRKSSRYLSGVVVADVLSLSTDPAYAQWGSRRAVDLVVSDVLAYLNDRVLLNVVGYPFAATTQPGAADVNQSTFNQIDADVASLFSQYPAGLLAGGRGVGWDWAAEGVRNGLEGPEPVFLLGVAPAKAARIIYVKIGVVEGRFVASSAPAAGQPGVIS